MSKEKYWAKLWRENWNAMFDRLSKTKQAQILAAPDGKASADFSVKVTERTDKHFAQLEL